jgi:hypothetical protein
MAMQVTMGAQLMCSGGTAPSALVVLPVNRTLSSNLPAATIMDHAPTVNIPRFGMCKLTKKGCAPVTPSPWVPGSPTVLIGSFPALNNTSTCKCSLGGTISIMAPGQLTELLP